MIEEIKEIAEGYFADAKPTHDWSHVERVYRLALHIGKIEQADIELLSIAVYLHDIKRKLEDELQGGIDHALEGTKEAKRILSNFNYQKIDEVCHCIETHRFRSGRKPETIEAKVLHDADRLDVIGAIGIARAYTFGGENKLQIYPPKPRQNLTKADSVYTSDWNAVYEFQVKLSKVKDSMLTGEGRRMAEGRHAFMVKFFERLEDEINGKP